MQYQIREDGNEKIFLYRVRIADCFWTRFLGLMGRPRLADGEGLFLKKVKSIHTCFMRFPILAIYLDKEYRVIATETLPPWRCGHIHKKAAHVLETGISDGAGIRTGMKLILEISD